MATSQAPIRSVDDIRVVNLKKQELNKRGIRDFKTWKARPRCLYIGRDMTTYIEGCIGSKWGNPYRGYKYRDGESIRLYEQHIRNTPDLYNSLEELLEYDEIGCWCTPNPCHGNILVKLLKEKLAAK